MTTGQQTGPMTAAELRLATGLEIGGGNRPFRRDFEQFDAEDHSAETRLVYTLGDARSLPYEDESIPQIYASNILEHFYAEDVVPVLTEWARVLKIGGLMELVVPDVMGILEHYYAERIDRQDCWVRLAGTVGLNRHHVGFTLAQFPAVIDQVSTLMLKVCEPCAEFAGIHALAIRVPG